MKTTWEERLAILRNILEGHFEAAGDKFGQTAFMKLTGVKRGRFYQIFNRNSMLTLDEAGILCKKLNINPEWLLGLSDQVSITCSEERSTENIQSELGVMILKAIEVLKPESPYRAALSSDITNYYNKLSACHTGMCSEKPPVNIGGLQIKSCSQAYDNYGNMLTKA